MVVCHSRPGSGDDFTKYRLIYVRNTRILPVWRLKGFPSYVEIMVIGIYVATAVDCSAFGVVLANTKLSMSAVNQLPTEFSRP